MFKRLDHVSIGVFDIEAARKLFCDQLGGELLKDAGTSNDEGFSWITFMLGGKKIELVTPHQAGEGGVGRYLEKNGEGFHHLSFSVTDLAAAKEFCDARKLRVLGYDPESSSFRHFYLHPKDTFGALIQVFEETGNTLDMAE